jgi:hypothetical protein
MLPCVRHPVRGKSNDSSAFGRCCPSTTECCPYGYCIEPDRTCCPGGSCRPGWGCCGTGTCYPRDGECCSNGNYCEAGNICVRLVSSNRIVCCTDLQCTARVSNGFTSTLSTAATRTSTRAVITDPPTTRTRITLQYETWSWRITWWYISFYWSTVRQTTSSVTYTTVYSTTTLWITATDETDARSSFSALSSTLTFPVPTEAQTSLAALLTSRPTTIATPTFRDDFSSETEISSESSTSSSSSTTRIQPPQITTSINQPGVGGASDGKWLGSGLIAMAAISALLMVWL